MRFSLLAAIAVLASAACVSDDDAQSSPTASGPTATATIAASPTATPTACPDYAALPAPTPSATPGPGEGTLLNGFLLLPSEEPHPQHVLDWLVIIDSPYPASGAPPFRIDINQPGPLLVAARPGVRDEQPVQERAATVQRDRSGKVMSVEVSYTASDARAARQVPVLTVGFGPSYQVPEPVWPLSIPGGYKFPDPAPWLPQPGIVVNFDGAITMLWHDGYGGHFVSWEQSNFPGVTPEDMAARLYRTCD